MIFHQLTEQLSSLSNLLFAINNTDYRTPVKHLGDASIGAHTRHIIELLQCAVSGYGSGIIDYVNRKRNLSLETDKVLAIYTLQELTYQATQSDKQLILASEAEMQPTVYTTYFREIVYNTEHIIHHLALIKVALIEQKLNVPGENFGVASSTIKYKRSLAG